ncbi:rhodanese-like domain-containing protein [Asticcacaulis sp. EMRT-3]|uniref:rhodanese-like domain-containing protein n=1 Tax=Asticcacaulis sp. EMRT-3 TaxID=3040349 RepID=UPI0024AF5990|nr:rhodanese-like domain-containing protein [Asticcacaulis sp. EMRT-3]MDI7774167.1 rhodanese-like domain-containing protein [Asticcacaulis sp. EMRT-3]
MPVINMSPEEVAAGLEAGQIVLVDVREPHEFDAERIKGAVSLPLSVIDPAALPDAGEKMIVLSCAGGVRSAKAAEYFQAMGLDIDHHLAGGLYGWKGAGLPTER